MLTVRSKALADLRRQLFYRGMSPLVPTLVERCNLALLALLQSWGVPGRTQVILEPKFY